MQMRTCRWRSRRPAVLGALVACAVLLSACGGSGFTYVGSAADRTFFKVPNTWTQYNREAMLVGSHLGDSPSTAASFRYLVGYDSDPEAAIDHVLQGVQVYPTITAWVRELDEIDHEKFSLEVLRDAYFNVDGLLQTHMAELLAVDDITLPGGVHGSKTVYDLSLGNYTVTSGNVLLRVGQIALLDAKTNLFYFFMVKCSAECYQLNQSLIDQIVNSFTVKEH
jgi:hypothetical protein